MTLHCHHALPSSTYGIGWLSACHTYALKDPEKIPLCTPYQLTKPPPPSAPRPPLPEKPTMHYLQNMSISTRGKVDQLKLFQLFRRSLARKRDENSTCYFTTFDTFTDRVYILLRRYASPNPQPLTFRQLTARCSVCLACNVDFVLSMRADMSFEMISSATLLSNSGT